MSPNPRRLLPFLLALALSATALAGGGVWPVGVSVAPDVGVPEGVFGVALGLPWGSYEAVIGIEAGLVANETKLWMIGLQATPGVNRTRDGVLAWQAAGVANFAEDTIGIQTAIAFNQCNDSLSGLQLGAVNFADNLRRGMQIGFFNRAGLLSHPTSPRLQHAIQIGAVNWTEDLSGTQIGLWNRAQNVHGLQFGLVNTADSLIGLQLGLANIVHSSPHPFLPLARLSF